MEIYGNTKKPTLRKIRAFDPWPGTFTMFNGRRLRITKALQGMENLQQKKPGSIIGISKLGISVATGKDTLIITELVPEGGKRVSGTDFSNSNVMENQVFGETAD